jgi:hypothetical protein
VLDIIKTISLSPRRTIPIISPSPRIFSITQWYTNGKRSLVLSLQPPPPNFFIFSTPTISGSQKGSWIQPRWICMSSSQSN